MNILENDTTEFIKQSITETQEQIRELRRVCLSEIESCEDYIEEAIEELKRRES